MYQNKYYKLAFFAIFSALYEAFMMVVIRGHYSIDLYAGFIFSTYACLLANKVCLKVDFSSIGLLVNQISGNTSADKEKGCYQATQENNGNIKNDDGKTNNKKGYFNLSDD